jgi:hypothetical protein
MTRTRPSAPTIAFSGLKSRWMSPAAWAAASPRPAARKGPSTARQERGCARIQVAEGPAGDEFHGDVELAVVGVDVVDADDVGVGELGERLRLALQPLAGVLGAVGGELGEQLEGDLAIELGIVGGVHDPHGPGAEPADHEVATDLRAGLELGETGGGRAPGSGGCRAGSRWRRGCRPLGWPQGRAWRPDERRVARTAPRAGALRRQAWRCGRP